MATGVQVTSDGKVSITSDGKVIISGSASGCCCWGCYQRWSVRWNCNGGEGFFDEVVPGDKLCVGSGDPPPSTVWEKIDTTDAYCDYQIYVPLNSGCSDDADCAALDDTAAPDPYGCVDEDCTGPFIALDGGGTPLDCCCCNQCCQPAPINLTFTLDPTGMIPAVPPGGWCIINPVAPGDWHFYAGNAAWTAHPETVFNNSGTIVGYQGGGQYFDCHVVPQTQPNGQVPGTNIAARFVANYNWDQNNATGGCGPEFARCDYYLFLGCNGDGTYTVTVYGQQLDDMGTGGPSPTGGVDQDGGVYSYSGEITTAVLACVNGRPTGTVVVPMTWDAGDTNFNPVGGPQDCGTLTVVFS